jgi:hypothetical protein
MIKEEVELQCCLYILPLKSWDFSLLNQLFESPDLSLIKSYKFQERMKIQWPPHFLSWLNPISSFNI